MKNLHRYFKFFFLFFIFLFFLFYMDRKVIIFLKNLYINYDEFTFYLKKFLKILEIFYKIFIIGIIFLGFFKFFKKKRKEGQLIFSGIIIAGILSQIKYLFGRLRPKVTSETIFNGPSLKYAYTSFPSGHTFFSFAMATILSYLYPRYRFYFYFFATLIGIGRVLSLSHFPSDVLAGAFLGILTVRILIKFFYKFFHDF